ncbi:dihydrolipoamide succinyltransferase, partial [Pseudomonas savastanoi pv. glycinea str. race 4]
MAIEIKAPSFPESVADGTISKWYKKEGDTVKRDEMLVDIETDKVVLEVLAEADGVMGSITKEEGAIVLSNEVLGTLNDGATASAATAPAAAPASAPAAAPAAAGEEDPIAAPAARQLAEENGINLASVKGTGKDGRITKEDVVAAVEAKKSAPAAAPAAKPAAAAAPVV